MLKVILPPGGCPTQSGVALRACHRTPYLGRLLMVIVLTTSVALAQTAPGTDTLGELRQLLEQQNRKLDALNEKVRLLEEKEQARQTVASEVRLPSVVIDTNGVPIGTAVATASASATPSTNQPLAQVYAGASGFSFRSADTNFAVTLHGLVQADSRTFFENSALSQGNNGFLLRRARPIIEGTLYRDTDFVIVPDFGGSSVQLFDAYVSYRLCPELQFRAGKFKGPVGLENLQTDTAAPFNERSLASDLVPMRNVGFQAGGEIRGGLLSWAAGVYDADGDYRVAGNSAFSNDAEFGGRLFLKPFQNSSNPLQGLGFGIGASISEVTSNSAALPSSTGGTSPGYVTPGQQQFFAYNPLYGSVVADGSHSRLSPQAFYYLGPFGVQCEVVFSEQEVLNNSTLRSAQLDDSAWHVSAQWILTGEKASFNAITPAHPFDPFAGHWGAWQLVTRYSELNIDKNTFNGFSDPTTSARSAASSSVGLNWWLNRNVRVLTSYSYTTFQGGGEVNEAFPASLSSPATVSHQSENVFFTRLQISF